MLFTVAMPSLLGFALLLSGLKIMEAPLRIWAGPNMRRWIVRSTQTPLRGFVAGAALSALLQSSSAVTVLTIGFVNAGLLSLPRSFGIVLGTNVGTCLTTELMSFELHRYGYPLLLAAALLWTYTVWRHEWNGRPSWTVAAPRSARESGELPARLAAIRYISAAAAGFALLLLGFGTLLSIGPAMLESEAAATLFRLANADWALALCGGALLTAVIHSSAAAVAMCMGLAAAGVLSPETGVAFVLGANVGTCFTGLVASLGGGRGGRFVALSQLALNAAGALLFFPLIAELRLAAAWLAPDNAAAQIAHAQTLFNVACSLLALPLAYIPLRSGTG